MILHYLLLSIRLLIRNPFFTFINVFGLSIGFALFFILWQHSQSELSSDMYHEDGDRIARIGVHWQWTDAGDSWGQVVMGNMSSRIGRDIELDFPEVESVLQMLHQPAFAQMKGHGPSVILSHEKPGGGDVRFREERAVYSDPNLFQFFSIPLIYGNKENALAEANTIVLSESTSKKFFGERNPVGELLTLNGKLSLKVTGVFTDLPHNTHLAFDFVISNRAIRDQWANFILGPNCYVKLKNGDFASFEKKLKANWSDYWAEESRAYPHVKTFPIIQPLREIAFQDEFQSNYFTPKPKRILVGTAWVAVIILVMGWANYVNLTLSRTKKRMKEVATRQMSGARGGDFIAQFVTEALVINSIAVVLAATMIQFLRHPVELFLHIHVPGVMDIEPQTFIFCVAMFIAGVLLTGLYPAMLPALNNPRQLFAMGKGRSANYFLPSFLTITQYVSAIILIFFAMIIHQQLNYLDGKDLGFDKNNVLLIDGPVIKNDSYSVEVQTFTNEVRRHHAVKGVTHQSAMINLAMRVASKNIFINTNGYTIDEHYLSLFRIPVIAGRNFTADDRADAIILTRFAAQRLKFATPQDAIGSTILIGPADKDWREVEIIGVVEDYKITSFYSSPNNSEAETGRGVAFLYGNKAFPQILPETFIVKLDREGSATASLAPIEKSYTKIFSGNIFKPSLLDGLIDSTYKNEVLARNQLAFFTGVAICIACLGVLGMMTNRVIEKKREIAIRKAMGAELKNISNVLLSNTFRQILFSIFISTPVAWYLSHQYLQRFTEQIPIRWWHFTFPVVLLLLIMFSTVSIVLIQAVRSNPVESLRQE